MNSNLSIDLVNRTLFLEDIVKGDDAFFVATGVTDGELLRGVQYKGNIGITQSIIIHGKSHSVRFIEGRHDMTTL